MMDDIRKMGKIENVSVKCEGKNGRIYRKISVEKYR
jgi:hypothetical protein